MRVRRVLLSLFVCSLLSAASGRAQVWDIGVLKSGPDTTTANADVTYAVTVFNSGPDDATTVTLTDLVPAGMTFVSETQVSGPVFTCDATVTCTIATLPAGTSADFNFTFHTDPAATPGTFYFNSASVTSGGGDVNAENDTAVYGTLIPAPLADLLISKSGPSAAAANSDVAYTVTVSNNGPDDSSNVSWNDTLPGDMTFVSLSQTGTTFSCTTPAVGGGGAINCSIATFPAGASVTFTLTGHIPNTALSGATYTNTASFAAPTTTDPNDSNNSDSTTTTVSSADLGITKMAPANATAGQNFDYVITLSNAGPDGASGASFTDFVPSGTTVVSVVQNTGPAFSCSPTSSYAFCSTAFLANGASAQFTVTVNVATSVADSTLLTNTATDASDSFDPNASNDSSSASTTIAGVSDIAVTKSGPANITAGTNITWDITVANNADGPASGVALTDTLPAGLTFVSLTQNTGPAFTCTTGATIDCAIASLAPFTTSTFTLVAAVAPNMAGAISNTATVSTTTLDLNPANNSATSTTTVDTSADLTVVKSGPATTLPNQDLSYTITVTNAGPSDAQNVAMDDSTPPATTFVSIAAPAGFTCTTPAAGGTGAISCTNPTLAAFASATFTLVVHTDPTAVGPIDNTATISCTTTDPNPANNSSTASGTTLSADLSIAKSGTAATAAGGAIQWTITVTNNGPADGASITLNDPLPAEVTFVSIAAPAGFACTSPAVGANGNINCTTATLANGATATFILDGLVAGATAPGTTITNTATVSSPNDTTPADNSASANTFVAAPPSISKSFAPASIALNGNSTLTFTITNPNPIALSGVAFSDSFPAGVVVATPNGVGGTCGGTTIANAGSTAITLTNGTVAASGSCTVTVDVTGTTAGVKINTSSPVTSFEGGTGSTASATLTVVTPATIAKAFGAASIPLNGTTSLTFTLTNPNATTALSGVAFNDALPAQLLVASPSALTSTCGGGVTASGGSNSIFLTGGTLTAGGTCTISVNVAGVAPGVANNITSLVSSTEGGSGIGAAASILVVAPPSITKAFGAASIPLNGTTSLTFTITNSNATVALTGIAFADTLPANLVVATPNGLAGACGGAVVATAGSNSVSLSGGTIAASTNCTFSVNVTGTAAGAANNTTSPVTSTEGGAGNAASASVTVVGPQTITKTFSAASIPLNGGATLTFTIFNGNTSSALTAVSFTDPLPANLVVSTPNALASTCGGVVTANAGAGSISLTGGSIAANGNCTISVGVTGITAGVANNTTGPVTSTEGGAGNTASATITVVDAPTIAKVFGAGSIPVNGSTSLTFTITNPNATMALTGVSFADALPAILKVTNPNGLANSCGGTVTATAGTSTISLAGGTVAAGGTCTMSVNVTGMTAGVANNTTAAVTSAEGGAGNTASATLTVIGPPSIGKAFGAATIPLNGTTSLTFTITNSNATSALTGIAFADTLPAKLVVSTPNGLAGACGGTVLATAGSNTISLTGGTIAAGGNCAIAVNVTGISSGVATNTTGVVSSTEGGAGNTATASVTVAGAATFSKSFGAATIPLNGTTSLTFTIMNPNVTSLTGVGFTDTLPAGLVVSTPNGLASTCSGAVTANAGSGSITLSGATLGGGASCTVAVTVTGTAAGVLTNTSGPITSNESGAGSSATATLTIVGPPTIAKTFAVPTVHINSPTQLTFTITNPNATVSLTGVSFNDTLPANLVVANPSSITSSCGGTVTAAAGSNSASLSGGTVGAGGTCTMSLNVVGIAPGPANNTTSVVTSANGGAGNAATAALLVVTGPVLTQTFGSSSIPLGGSTTLTFTLSNPNPGTTLTGINFSDTLPTNLIIATPNGLVGGCGAATITADAGTSTITFSGGTLAPGASCSFTINVTGEVAGTANNNITPSSSAGAGAASFGTIVVLAPDLTITKTHAGSLTPGNSGSIYTLTVSNTGTGPTLGTVMVTDSLPAGLIATAIQGNGWTCTLASLTCTRTDALPAGASYPAISLVVDVDVNAPQSITNQASVSGGGELNTSNDTASDAASLSAAIPALSPLSLLFLGFALASAAMLLMRRMS